MMSLTYARSTIRLQSIDLMCGIVMVLMALDHVRDYFMGTGGVNPLDVAHTNGLLFATRWITHLCAPTFVLLAGVSAYLSSKHCTKGELAKLLVTRGLWLIFLEWTVVTFAWTFNFDYPVGLIMQVIWAIGMSMIVLAALVWMPTWVVGLVGVAMCCAHNLLDGVSPVQFGVWAPVWKVLHVQGPTPFGYVHYPLIPWIGVMAAGYALGTVYNMESSDRRRILVILGVAAIVTFILLRATNIYGDPKPWSPQPELSRSVMAFMNVTKYPPSLLYLLATLGPALLLLTLLESARGRVPEILATFGRVPLFFYVLHLMLAHLAAGLTALFMGYGTTVLANFFLAFPKSWGVDLGAAYLAWVCVVVILYPLCRWFGAIKQRRRDWWLIYL